MTTVVDSTPVDSVDVRGRLVLVKREDLCCPLPGPSFSKMRGVFAHMARRPERVIGVLDTFHSKAGWAVAYAGRALGKVIVNYWPRYKADVSGALREQQATSASLGATLVELKAGRSAILFHQAKKHLAESYADSYMMPNALKLNESVDENANEARRTIDAGAIPPNPTVVISISSGTVAAGVIRGFADAGVDASFILHMGYSRSEDSCRSYISRQAVVWPTTSWRFIDEGYAYADKCRIDPPFPCNAYYDAKAWRWLLENVDKISGPVVFWNIGA